MSCERFEDPSLRKNFAARAEVTGGGEQCPAPDRLWASAGEELRPPENEAIILHLGECTACAAAWRLARELRRAEVGQSVVAPIRDQRLSPALRLRRWVPLAAAALLLVALGTLLQQRLPSRRAAEPVYRTQESRWLESELDGAALLARSACLLRWAAGPEGTTYDLQVMTENLEPLARAARLDRPEYQVEEEALQELVAGSRILWRVTAHLPDGRRVLSRTFVSVIR